MKAYSDLKGELTHQLEYLGKASSKAMVLKLGCS